MRGEEGRTAQKNSIKNVSTVEPVKEDEYYVRYSGLNIVWAGAGGLQY